MKKKFYQKTWFKVIAALFIISIIVQAFMPKPYTASEAASVPVEAPKSESKPSLQMAEIKAKRYIKENLKDPDSYEVLKAEPYYLTAYKGDSSQHYMQVIVTYRAKNSFGGFVINKQAVTLSADFTPLEIFETK